MDQRSFVWKSLQIIARVGTTLLFDLKTYGRENVPKMAACCSWPIIRAISIRSSWPCIFIAR